jgi:hypothetical protein
MRRAIYAVYVERWARTEIEKINNSVNIESFYADIRNFNRSRLKQVSIVTIDTNNSVICLTECLELKKWS